VDVFDRGCGCGPGPFFIRMTMDVLPRRYHRCLRSTASDLLHASRFDGRQVFGRAGEKRGSPSNES
jgi:hypothetical protein